MKPNASDTYKHFLFLMVTRGPSPFKKCLYFPLCMSHKSVTMPQNTRCFMNITLSLKWFPRTTTSFTASRSWKLYYRVMQHYFLLTLKSGLETLRKVIKRNSQLSEPTIHNRIIYSIWFHLPYSIPVP